VAGLAVTKWGLRDTAGAYAIAVAVAVAILAIVASALTSRQDRRIPAAAALIGND
jgi:hypothetical protein